MSAIISSSTGYNVASMEAEILRTCNPAFWFNEKAYECDPAPAGTLVKWHDRSPNQNIATAISNGTSRAAMAHASPVTGADGMKRLGVTIGDNQHLTLATAAKVEWAFAVAVATGANGQKGMILAENSAKWWGCRQPDPGNQPWLGGMAEGTTIGGRRALAHGARAIYGFRYQSEQYLPGISPGHLVCLGMNGYDHWNIGNNVTFTADTLFGYPTATYDFNGTAYEIIAGSSPLTEDRYAYIERYLAAKWSVALDPGKRFVLLGDSIGRADAATGWLKQLFGTMNLTAGLVDAGGDTSWNAFNMSYNGNSTVNGVGSPAMRFAKPTCARNVLCVHLGTNDLYYGFTAADALDRLDRIGRQARANGYTDVWLIPMLSRTALDAAKNAYNAAALALVASGSYTAMLSPSAIPALCDDGAYANATNFPDGTHPSTAGHAILAAAIKANLVDTI